VSPSRSTPHNINCGGIYESYGGLYNLKYYFDNNQLSPNRTTTGLQVGGIHNTGLLKTIYLSDNILPIKTINHKIQNKI